MAYQPTIDAYWQTYKEKVVPKDAGAEQVQATRDAFFGGFSMALEVLYMIGEPDISEEEGMAIIDSLQEEMVRYVEKVRLRPVPKARRNRS